MGGRYNVVDTHGCPFGYSKPAKLIYSRKIVEIRLATASLLQNTITEMKCTDRINILASKVLQVSEHFSFKVKYRSDLPVSHRVDRFRVSKLMDRYRFD